MEIWGGIECTINRIQDQYFDQLDYNGHYDRLEDLALIADLGIKKLRYPILWEKNKPNKDLPISWHGTAQLEYLKNRDIDVIAGLVHHGSGPEYANIIAKDFPEQLASYALEVAKKFPWINYFTPVNEPLTTARFCGLYGHWHPHEKNDQSFLRMLFNECRATVLAMQAIRTITPSATLVFTEDLGKCHSTEKLAYQATFENQRRWLSIDLICGKVDEDHALWDYLVSNGISPGELAFFNAEPISNVILGFNYYITSERFIDEDICQYASHLHGGNGMETYADIEAIRTSKVDIDGVGKLLSSAWERYQLPMAITEAHLNCGREDQLRWLQYIVCTARELNKNKINVVAVTAWSLLGAYGWNKLLTQKKGDYEAGAFDLSNGKPRPTAITKLIRGYANDEAYCHAVIENSGWWERPGRILYGDRTFRPKGNIGAVQPVLIIGATGTLGKAFIKVCGQRGITYKALTRSDLDFHRPDQIDQLIAKYRPWAIINAAGFVRVDDAELELENCYLSNTDGPAYLAKACQTNGIQFLTFSSDLVFDGVKTTGYVEEDMVNPLNVYGHSKAKAEELILETNPDALIVRTSAFFSPWDRYNFVAGTLESLRNNCPFNAADDVYISPTYVPHLVNACLDSLIDEEKGIWHLANVGSISWYDLAVTVAERSRFNPKLIHAAPLDTFKLKAKRPAYSVLSSSKSVIMPTLEQALDNLFNAG